MSSGQQAADDRRGSGSQPVPEAATAPTAPEPLDLRLVPAAIAAWVTAWWAVAQEAHLGVVVVAAVVWIGVGVLALRRARRYRPARHRADPRPGVGTDTATVRGPASASVALSALAACAVLVVSAAGLHARAADPLIQAARAGREVSIEAVVATAPRATASQRATSVLVELTVLSVDGRASRQRAMVFGREGWLHTHVGERVQVRTRLQAAEPGSGEAAVIGAQAQPRVVGPPSGALAVVGRLREGLVEAAGREGVQARRWPPGSHALVPGVALGDDSALPGQVREQMRAVSLTHLTAVSGQHVAILAGLVLSALGILPRRWRALAGAVALAGLVVLVRPSGSVLRAAAMGSVMLLGVALGRRSATLPSLCGALVVLLLVDPWQSRDYGFALSAAATGGIVLGTAPVQAGLGRWLPRWLATVLAVPLVAQAACAPLLVMLQPSVGLWAVPANVLAAPAVPVATLCGLAAALVAPLWLGLAAVVAWPALVGCAWLALVARAFASLPGAVVAWPEGVWGAVALAAIETTAVLVGWRSARAKRRSRGG
ncbi:MAG: ComEC/Rec2 family competence protein [Actinomyces urogenitalis]|uniref:ComEC/Rec2 family competence protein n=1 Tax=Actinomyces urogenitalis TaxID=103621 RepID=UPI00051050EC|nr:ComEC/Rec2 family competence protein [Actinomyces urogenitalis]KGF04944.1 competence protein ComEC [Actinomyces urogenitalis S6-C4]MDU5874184.1 ComEC/Rec2 family competence protein [Actinomyces urogenitalis]